MTDFISANSGHAQFADIDVSPPVSLAGPHLLDGELPTPDAVGSKHLTECGWCRERRQAAQLHWSDDDLDEEEFLRAARQRAEAGGTAGLADVTRLSTQLHALTQEPNARDDVAVGQLWRLRWDQASELAVIIAIDTWWVTVAPVTTDTAAADEFSPLLAPTASALNVALAVCVSLECTVPMFVFDRQIASAGRTTSDQRRAAAQLPSPQTLRDIWRAWRRSTAPPEGVAYGTQLDDGDLDRRELRSVIASSFAPLVGASAEVPGADPIGVVVPLGQRVRDSGLRPPQLAHKTGLPLVVFTRINRGGRISPDEAAKLAPVLDTDEQTLMNANPAFEDDLVTEVSRPRHRPILRRLAVGDATDENQQRWKTAYEVSPTAARAVTTNADGAVPASQWAEKVDQYLSRRLAELDRRDARRP